jgi:hypothetical protein
MKCIRSVPNPEWETAEYLIVDKMFDGTKVTYSMRVNLGSDGQWVFVPKYILREFDDEDKALEDWD